MAFIASAARAAPSASTVRRLIHPEQVADANGCSHRLRSDVAFARQIIAAFERPENKGKGVITMEGRMVELLHAKMAPAYRRHCRGHRRAGHRPMTPTKGNIGNFFEDFRIGQVFAARHPRTITLGDVALYAAFTAPALPCNRPTPSRKRSAIRARRSTTSSFFMSCSARALPDISLNAIANLGYAECRFCSLFIPAIHWRRPRK